MPEKGALAAGRHCTRSGMQHHANAILAGGRTGAAAAANNTTSATAGSCAAGSAMMMIGVQTPLQRVQVAHWHSSIENL